MDNTIIKNLISYCILASLFVTGNGIFEVGFSFYWYYFIYIPFAIYGLLIYHKINTNIALVFLGIIVYVLVNFEFGLAGLAYSIKQIFNLALCVVVFYTFLQHEGFNYENIFRKYILCSKIILAFGFFQVGLFSLGHEDFLRLVFPFLSESNLSIRFQSLTQEPSFIAFVFVPVVFLSLRNMISVTNLFINKTWSLLFILAYILTFSLVAYVGILLMMLILFCKKITVQRILFGGLFLFILAGIGSFIYNYVNVVRLKINDTLNGISIDITKDEKFKELNFSTYAILSNYYVTKKSLSNDPLFGCGLGSYKLAYEKYQPANMKAYSQINNDDASSMGLRLLTETGFVGFIAFCYFIWRFRIRYKSNFSLNEEILWILNAGIFVMLLLFLLRNGNYTIQGKVLFAFIYYFTYRTYISAYSIHNNQYKLKVD